ncbi:MAG: hypothetical protein VX587_03175 [Thermoproteota archaeon]|nr:hypothetical protein [Thermoproteota archaeon]
MRKIILIALFCLLLLPTSAFAHKLIPTDGTNIDYDTALDIPNPVISWAMYEELQDKPLFYKFEAKKGDRLYASIVIPKLEPLENFTPSLVLIGPETFLELVNELRVLDSNTDFDYPLPDGYTAYVFDYDGPIPSKEFYEPFGQITYWERQEIDLKLEAPGKYYMAVFDKNGSSGKLAVAIGYVEDFSGNDFVTVLPNAWLESRYFSEDFSSLYIFLGVVSGIFGLIGFGIYKKVR